MRKNFSNVLYVLAQQICIFKVEKSLSLTLVVVRIVVKF